MKTNFLITLLLLVFTFGEVQAQCPPGDVVLNSDSDVANFIAQYPNCTEINGDLDFGFMMGGGVITSTDGMQNIEIIHGKLNVYWMSMYGAEPCLSLQGLSSLHTVGGITIDKSHFCGFQDLVSLQNINGSVYIHESSGFADFSGFENIESLGDLFVEYMYSEGGSQPLVNFNGLQNLISIDGTLMLSMLWETEDFTGFENLQSISGGWVISQTSIHTLEHFSSINNVGLGIMINGNQNLSYCSIDYFCSNSEFDQTFVSFENYNGFQQCVHYSSVLEYCSSSSIEGSIYADLDCDESIGLNDVLVPSHVILSNDLPIALSNSTGSYSGWLQPDQTSIIRGMDLAGFTSQSFEIITPSLSSSISNMNIAMCPDSIFPNITVHITPIGVPNPGFNNAYNICVKNIGTVPVDAVLTLDVTSLQTWGQLISAGGGTLTGNTITWNISDLALFETVCFQITSQTTVGTPLGTLIELFAYVFLDSGTYTEYLLEDNEHHYSHEVFGSYDPNDKEVNITAIDIAEVETSDGVSLEYLIRFQNTGTFPATFVRVIDILPQELNPATIQMLSASHDYELIFHSSNKLEWFFDEINLADSTTNEPESHGYIHFRISTHPNLVVDESITNRVSIYFDYNAPVITNYAITNIGQCINVQDVSILIDGTSLLVDTDGVEYEWFLNGQPIVGASGQSFVPELSGNYSVTVTFENGCEVTSDLMMVSVSVAEQLADKIHLFPNPAKDNVMLELPQGNWQVSFTDITGKTILENHNLTQGRHNINLNSLSAGLYLIRISSESGSVVKKMMVNN